MSWRASAQLELRTRVSPELLAAGLVVLVAIALVGSLVVVRPFGTQQATVAPTTEPIPSATPLPTARVEAPSIRAILVLNERIDAIATEFGVIAAAKPFVTTEAASALRRLNASITSAKDLAARLARDPRTAATGAALQQFYEGLMTTTGQALGSALSNVGAYQSALTTIASRMPELSTLNEQLRGLLD